MFVDGCGWIFTRYGHRHIFRLFSHLYHAHYDQMLHLEQEAHLNTLLRHCTLLAKEFQVYRGCLLCWVDDSRI